MALVTLTLAPNVIKDTTALAAEGGVVDSNNVRFVQGLPQTCGGTEKAVGVGGSDGMGRIGGPARGMHAWTSLLGLRQAAMGTPNKLWVLSEGTLIDATPNHSEGVLENPFDTTSGSPTVTVNHAEHGARTGDEVTFSHADAGGGITINGTYTIESTPTRDTYTITHGSNASSTAPGVGGFVDFVITFPPGLTDGTGGLGYGTGLYGAGTYGFSSVNSFLPSVWSFGNFGEVLLANRRGGALYAWQPAAGYLEIALNGDFASSASWALGTGWSIGSGHATASAGVQSNLSQNVVGAVLGGYVYRITFDVVQSAGTLKFRVNAGETPAVIDVGINADGDSASAPINKTGTYTRTFVMPADPVDIVFEKDGSFAGQIDNVSLKLESRAYRVDTAPRLIDTMWVDGAYRIVNIAGTYEADGDYNPLIVRNSAQGNFRVWIPDGSNLADEYGVSAGGRIIRGLPTRQQTLIFTDAAVISQQFAGDETATYSYRLIGTGCGLMGANAVVEVNGQVFWYTIDGKMNTFQGAISQVIVSLRMRQDVKNHIAINQNEKFYCWVNSEYNEIWTHYPDSRDGNECSRVIAYNYLDDNSVPHLSNHTAGLSAGIFPSPLLVSADGEIFYRERGFTENGGALQSRLLTGYFNVADGQFFQRINRFVPDFKDQQGNISLTIYLRNFPNAPVRTVGPYTITPTTIDIPLRVMAREMALLFESSASPSFWGFGAPAADIEPTGTRR